MDINKLKELGLEYLQKGKEATLDLTEKATNQVKLVNLQTKLQKEERELGKIVYKLAQEGQTNQPVIDAQVAKITAVIIEISKTKEEIAAQQTRDTNTAKAKADVEYVDIDTAKANIQPFCTSCGNVVTENATFCASCGEKL